MPVYGHRLMSFRCLVTGEYAELKRQDGKSDKPGIFPPLTSYIATGGLDKTRFKQGMFKTKSKIT